MKIKVSELKRGDVYKGNTVTGIQDMGDEVIWIEFNGEGEEPMKRDQLIEID